MPSATAREFQRVALALGFVRRRQTGSHERWSHSDGRSVTIPLHGGREIGPPLFFTRFFDNFECRSRNSIGCADNPNPVAQVFRHYAVAGSRTSTRRMLSTLATITTKKMHAAVNATHCP